MEKKKEIKAREGKQMTKENEMSYNAAGSFPIPTLQNVMGTQILLQENLCPFVSWWIRPLLTFMSRDQSVKLPGIRLWQMALLVIPEALRNFE